MGEGVICFADGTGKFLLHLYKFTKNNLLQLLWSPGIVKFTYLSNNVILPLV